MSGLLNKKTISLQKQINDINTEIGELATGVTADDVIIHSVGTVNPLAVGATVTNLVTVQFTKQSLHLMK